MCAEHIEEDTVNYIRGRVARVLRKRREADSQGELIHFSGGEQVEIDAADMVVLATAGVASCGSEQLAQKLHVSYDPYHFFAEAHPKLKTS